MKPRKEALFLRVETELNTKLKEKADNNAVSLNEYCVSILGDSLKNGFEFEGREFSQIISKSKLLFQNNLLAVIVFGSRARGDFTSESDLDVLIVLDQSAEVTRKLYSIWDREKCKVTNLSVHFSKLPDNSLSGFWCEIALDGIVIFDKSLIVSQFIIELRTKILSGEYKAKYSHGHRYWIEEVAA